jgi:hypothetical protein
VKNRQKHFILASADAASDGGDVFAHYRYKVRRKSKPKAFAPMGPVGEK